MEEVNQSDESVAELAPNTADEVRAVHEGMVVLYVDSQGKPHNALVTAVHGPENGKPSINVAYLNDTERDSWGRRLERASSTVHQSKQSAHGNYWEFID